MSHPLRPRVARALLPCIVLLLSACGGGGDLGAAVDAAAPEVIVGDPAEPGAEVNSDSDASWTDAPEAAVNSTLAEAGEAAELPDDAELPPMGPASLLKDLPRAGYAGGAAVPLAARAEDVSRPTTVVGQGTPASCTSSAFVRAVARGGVITFNCGNQPVTITLAATAKIMNNGRAKTVIDGGGKVTLSGGGKRRIIYMNTCDPDLVWTTSHCDNQDHPRLTLQNLTFVDGKSSGTNAADAYGGGAVFARGGRLKIVKSRFFRNRCDSTGPDVGGGAVRALDQYEDRPLYIVNSTFGGRSDLGNTCSNGGALSSIGVSYAVYNSLFTYNKAIGYGANPARSGTPGGGSGGAIYNDGDRFHLRIFGSRISNNRAREGGGAIFFVSNDRTGTLAIRDAMLAINPSGEFETAGYPGIFYLGSGLPVITGSTLLR